MKHCKTLVYVYTLIGIIILCATIWKFGPGIDNDGVSYSLFGKTLAQNWNFNHYDDHFKGLWPPLFPIIIAIFQSFHLPIFITIGFLNVVLFAFTLIIASKILLKDAKTHHWPHIAIILIIFSYPLLDLYSKVLTDPPFIFLTTLLVYKISRLENRFNFGDLSVVTICLALLPILRYAGLFCDFIAIGYLFAFFWKRHTILWKICLISIISAIPIGLWFLRNYRSIFGNYFGQNSHTGLQISINPFWAVRSMPEVMSAWIIPKIINPEIRIILFLTAVSIFLYLLVIKHKIRFKKISIITVFLISYLIIITITVPPDALEPRYLVPVYILFVIQIFNLLHHIEYTFLRPFLYIFISLMFLNQISTSCIFVAYRFIEGGGGYNTQAWQNSKLGKRIKLNHLSGLVLSNNIGPVQYFNEQFAEGFSTENLDSSHRLSKDRRNGYIIWVKESKRNIENPVILPLPELNKIIRKTLNKESSQISATGVLSEKEYLEAFCVNNCIQIKDAEFLTDGDIYRFIPRTN